MIKIYAVQCRNVGNAAIVELGNNHQGNFAMQANGPQFAIDLSVFGKTHSKAISCLDDDDCLMLERKLNRISRIKVIKATTNDKPTICCMMPKSRTETP